jgi:nitrogen fixation protein NifQ
MNKTITQNKIVDLLDEYSKDRDSDRWISVLISQKCFDMGHLYHDMGFASRIEMNAFMTKHYPSLAAKKPVDIRWKKFLFDAIGEIAPACWQCKDSGNCFKCDILEKSA